MEDSDRADHLIDFPDYIRAIQDQLVRSQEKRESQDIDPLFQVEGLTIETNVIVSESSNSNIGFDIKVLSSDIGAEFEDQRIQKIKLELDTVDGIHPQMGEIPHTQYQSDEEEEEVWRSIKEDE